MKTILATAVLLFLLIAGKAQNIFPATGPVGIGTISPNSASLLEVSSVKKGVLLPRMTKAQRDSIKSPVTGLLLFQTDNTAGFYYYSGSAWTAVSVKGPNKTLSNLTAPTAVNVHLLAGPDTLDLGSGTKRWRTVYTQKVNASGSYLINGSNALAMAGDQNVSVGVGYLAYGSPSGYYNSAVGSFALYQNSTGQYNVAMGRMALAYNVSGSFNTAVGEEALNGNNQNYNTACGYHSLYATTASQYNTAVGSYAGSSYNNGYNNVFVGANTDVNGAGYYNVIAIGQQTICTASSQVTIGNSATGSYRAYANWSNISDGRYKNDVKENVPGLKFINKLRPVTYTLDATGIDRFLHKNVPAAKGLSDAGKTLNDKAIKEKEQVRYTGFVAQEVEQTARQLGFDFSGVDAPKNENDLYGLRYAEFVVPLVKAVQELSKMKDAQNIKIDTLMKMIASQQSQINELQKEIHAMVSSAGKIPATNLPSAAIRLDQNIPNPASSITTIKYFIPNKFQNARLLITDASGKAIRSYAAATGEGQQAISMKELAAGSYQYTLYANGQVIASKQMVILK